MNTTEAIMREHFKMEEVIKIKNKTIHERMRSGPKSTRIVLTDHDTGEVLADVHNKVLITGGQFTACKQFGIDPTINFPNYNEDLGLDNTLDYDTIQPKNEPIICLFCVGNDGCGTLPLDTYPVKYTDRIDPKDLIPFRYVDAAHDLNDQMRGVYFGRKTDFNEMISYYFKTFDTEPQLHLRYLDGTQITPDVYDIDSSQNAECYVETRLRITRQDFRDYFEKVTGWDNAVINSLSLLYAWYDDTIDDYLWYQQVFPFSKLHIPNEYMVDLTKAVDIHYSLYY